jgi:tRNA1Val (adenine37-N6)-methyltransferase
VTPAELEARRLELEAELGEPITLDGLSATSHIFQRRHGHRHSTDDMLTAWYAVEHAPDATRALDLGTGIGTVALLVLDGLPTASVVAVEAQAISYRFLIENVRANNARLDARHGDLRELVLAERFPLVTGSPPYFAPSAGIVPADSQKAHARFELRGDIGDYARAARRHLAPDGWFVFCFPFAQQARALAAVRAEGFAVAALRDVIPREGLAPLFSLFACRLEPTTEVVDPPFVVRYADGSHSAELLAVRRRFGW